MKRAVVVTAIVCIVWFIVVTFVIIFQCNPVHAYWEHFDLPPYCQEYPRVLLGYELTNLFIDVIILCIPVGIVPRLHLSTSKKVTVIVIFFLGAL